MGVSKNNGTPKSSIWIGFSIVNHPFWGTLFLETPTCYMSKKSKRRACPPYWSRACWTPCRLLNKGPSLEKRPSRTLKNDLRFEGGWRDEANTRAIMHYKHVRWGSCLIRTSWLAFQTAKLQTTKISFKMPLLQGFDKSFKWGKLYISFLVAISFLALWY